MFELAAEGEPQGIWFWASIYILLVCFYSLWFQLRTRSWPSTRGELLQLGAEKFGAGDWATSSQDYVGKALYTYSVAERQYQGSRISPWVFVASHNARFLLEKQLSGIQACSDGGVKVYYNPRNPRKSYLVVAGPIGIVVTLLLGISPLVFYWLKYLA